jgi:hypothetical protein
LSRFTLKLDERIAGPYDFLRLLLLSLSRDELAGSDAFRK